jgi:transcription initiation factor TFIID subunit TAF12
MPTIQTITDAQGRLQHSGAGSLRVDEEFVWHPNTIRSLMAGEVMFSTLAKVVKNNWPEYSVEESDVVISPLKVDNIADTITAFEQLKAKRVKNNINPDTIYKIQTMTDEQFQIYRKMQWNTLCQQKKQPTTEIPDNFLKTKTEAITMLKTT